MDENLQLKITAALETAEAANSAKELKASMRELNALAEQVGVANSEAYNQIKQAAGAAALQVKEMNASTKALAGTPIQATAKSFGLMKESLATMNFEQLTKSITLFSGSLSKMNPAGLTEGFGKLGSSLATLGKALLTNPIFLIGAAVVFIITQFDKLKEAGGVIGKVFGAIGATIHAVIKAITDFTDAIGLTDIAGKKASEAKLKYLEKEKQAIEERYNYEIAAAKATNGNVGKVEAEKYEMLKKSTTDAIKEYEKRKKEHGFLTAEEKEKEKELYTALTKLNQDFTLKIIEGNKKIIENEEAVLSKIEEAHIENMADGLAKEKAKAELAAKQKTKEVGKSLTEQLLLIEGNRAMELKGAEGNAEKIKAINDKYDKEHADANKARDKELVESNATKTKAIEKAIEDAEKKRLEELKKGFEKELKLNADEQAIITGNISLSEDERTNQLKRNLDARNDILIREKKAKILTSDEATDEIIKNTQTEQKLDADLAKKKEEEAKKEEARILKLRNDELKALFDIATEKKRGSDNLRTQLEADVELTKLDAQKKFLNDKLTTEQTLQLWIGVLAKIQKLKVDYAQKQNILALSDNQKAIDEELKTIEKKKGIWLGTELSLIKRLSAAKQALLDAQLKADLRKEEGNAAAIAAIKKKYNADTLKNAEDTNRNIAADELKTINQISGYTKAGIDAASGLSDLADQADKNRLKKGEKLSEETQKREFKRHQALSYANAILNTAEGISKAVAESPETGGLPGSALAALMGGLQIAKIASTKFEPSGGASSGSSGASAPNITAPSMASAPSLNNSGSSFRAGQFYGIGTANMNNNTGNNKVQPQQVYVLESDITKTQNKVSVQSGRATLSGRH